MDKFVVSARKYRPQTFDTVVGQAHITTTLKNAIQHNQLAHAFLFCGPRGVGKTTCARILAKTINCQNLQPDGEACNTCNSCTSFNDGASLNIHELDAASNNSVEDIRTLVEQVRFAPQAGKYKVYIVDEVHMLSTSAFNAFLKTLEEPPSYAIFILATTEKHKILPTILSRCQIFDFKRITTNDTVEHLQQITQKENIQADKASLQIIAQKSEGCMRDALSILDKIVSFTNGEVNYTNTLEHLNILDHDYYFKILEHLQKQELAHALLIYDEINRKGFEGDLVLNGLAEFIRNLLVCKDEKSIQLLDVVEGMQEKYKTVAQQTDLSYLVSALNILNEAEINFKTARNKKLLIELTLIKLNFLQQAIELAVNDGGTLVKKKSNNQPVAVKYKPIQSLQIQTTAAPAAKLYIETTQPKQKTVPNNTITLQQVQEPQPSPAAKPITPATPNKQVLQTDKKNLLEILRQKAGDKYTITEVKEAESLQIEKLQTVWNNYAQQLQNKEDKHATVGTFKLAQLQVVNDIQFIVKVNALTQQKFIEQEKTLLLDSIQTAFNNRAINFIIEIVETEEPKDLPLHLTLNTKQKFELLVQKNPLIQKLKDGLKLDIESI